MTTSPQLKFRLEKKQDSQRDYAKADATEYSAQEKHYSRCSTHVNMLNLQLTLHLRCFHVSMSDTHKLKAQEVYLTCLLSKAT